MCKCVGVYALKIVSTDKIVALDRYFSYYYFVLTGGRNSRQDEFRNVVGVGRDRGAGGGMRWKSVGPAGVGVDLGSGCGRRWW